MLISDGLLRVFWPYNLSRSTSPGAIVGWRNSELDLFVVSVLEDVEVRFRTLFASGDIILAFPNMLMLMNHTSESSRGMLKMPCALVSCSATARILSHKFSPSVDDPQCMFWVLQMPKRCQPLSIHLIFM
jgi:hypothetical protein